MKKVIVELRAGREFSMDAVGQLGVSQTDYFTMDASYSPVPVPPTEQMAAAMEVAGEGTYLIRGEVFEDREADLRNLPNVVNVWTDARIEAFGCGCGDASLPEEASLVLGATAALAGAGTLPAFGLELAPSPCPPTDCDPGIAKGDINDVAKYLKCDRLWAKGIRGQGVVVGVCDTGVDKTAVPAVIGGWTPNPAYPPGTDPGGHGSMCATDVMGMAPDAKIYDIGILKSTGTVTGLLSDAIAAYNWAINQYKANGTPQILSNSWGLYQKSWGPDYATDANHPFTRKVVEAIDLGIIVTFAAGNCGQVCPSGKCGTDTGPAKSIWGANGHPKVITVGAANILEQWIGYTSQGPAALDPKKPDFCGLSHFKGYTASDNGTSAANPICAGVIALLRSHDPALRADRAKEGLQKTAKNICSAGWDQHSGYGIIQAESAFNFLYFGVSTLVHACWIHGVNAQEEFPANLKYIRRAGFYSEFEGNPGTFNWFHLAIPTPVIVENVRLKLDSIILMFLTDPDVSVRNVHIYDGAWRIKEFNNTSLSGSHLFERFDVLNVPVRFGISVSIGVHFGTAAGTHFVRFISAGGDFIK